MENDATIVSPKHKMAVPGLRVFIAPKAVGRLFQASRLHPLSRLQKTRKTENRCFTRYSVRMSCTVRATITYNKPCAWSGNTMKVRKKAFHNFIWLVFWFSRECVSRESLGRNNWCTRGYFLHNFEKTQDLRKIGFHAKIEGIFPKKAQWIALLRTKDCAKTGQLRKS